MALHQIAHDFATVCLKWKCKPVIDISVDMPLITSEDDCFNYCDIKYVIEKVRQYCLPRNISWGIWEDTQRGEYIITLNDSRDQRLDIMTSQVITKNPCQGLMMACLECEHVLRDAA